MSEEDGFAPISTTSRRATDSGFPLMRWRVPAGYSFYEAQPVMKIDRRSNAIAGRRNMRKNIIDELCSIKKVLFRYKEPSEIDVNRFIAGFAA